MNPVEAFAAEAGRADHEADAAAVVADSVAGLLAARVAATPNRAAVAVAVADRVTTWPWAELADAALRAADELSAAGLGPGDRVAHLGLHTPDWFVIDLACLLGGFVHVPLHADATAAEHRSQREWLAPRAVVTSGGRKAGGITSGRVIAPPAGGWLTRAAVDPARVAAKVAARAAVIDADACATIVLSSGTTGVPHGVLHSQRALALNARAVSDVFLPAPRDVRLSWLPASHLLARVGDLYTAIERGGCLNLVTDRTQILTACRALPPTVILGVPAFFERLEAGVRSGRLGDLAAALGGEVRVCVSGGAPLRQRTAEFFAARGVPLVEGYGLAEAGPVVALSNPRIMRTGAVGPPLAGVEVKLDERPESRGQLLVKTPSRALGVLPPDGEVVAVPEWLETGDLATLDEAGQLVITGRLKDVIVLASGQKLPPAEVERALAEDEAVAQVCVVGDGLAAPVALVVPEPAVIRHALRRLGLVVFSRSSALRHPRLVAWLSRRLARRQRHLPRAWQVKRVVLVGRPFDAAHGEATESLKLKRQAIAEHFAAEIADGAAQQRAPAGRWQVSPGSQPERLSTSLASLLTAVWQGGDGGFAAAAVATASPLSTGVEAVLERAEAEIAALRADGRLYIQHASGLPLDQHASGSPPDQHASGPAAIAPIDDPPPPPRGKFSRVAEAALGEAGLWGLAVPEAFGGSGATMVDLARAITRLAAEVPTAAGMLAVHSSIGAVSALAAFGTPDQQARHLPGLAAGRPLSIFGATEPDAGCDLGRVQSVLERRAGRLLLRGTKMFITGATYGRLVKLLALHEGRPTVVLVQLPETDSASFRLRHYGLHPLKHAHNAALEFTDFEVHEDDVLTPPAGGDGMPIIWHGLNRGRTTLAAQAAGTLRLLLAHAAEHARRRTTWGRPIATRELVQGRLGRIQAAIVACDALAAWAAAAVDAGGGEWEAITAKVVASTCVREAAIDSLGIHGGRAFLVGHPLGDSLHDHFAIGVYEGESDLLGLALFRGLVKGHPLATRHPLAALTRHAGRLQRLAGWLPWRAGAWSRGSHHDDAAILDRGLRDQARAARRGLAAVALAIDRAIRRHGRSLAERQLEIGGLSARVRDFASVLATAHHADASGDEAAVAAADVWGRLALARAAGRPPAPADLAALAAVGVAAATSVRASR